MPKKVLYGICKECAKCYQRSAVYENNLEGLMGQYLSKKLMLVRGGVGV